MVWGQHHEIAGSSDLFATPFPFKIDKAFENFKDTILLVDKGEKSVSSSVGHGLMKGHPYAESRFKQANENMLKLSNSLQQGNIKEFIEIVENEALSLHAMMLTSNPSYVLMQPNTLKIIELVREFRSNEQSNLCFTLDAGANVHLLYPEKEEKRVAAFIEKKLSQFCQENRYICDTLGAGSVQLD
jgi:diphosphomevalonate decarboxylase